MSSDPEDEDWLNVGVNGDLTLSYGEGVRCRGSKKCPGGGEGEDWLGRVDVEVEVGYDEPDSVLISVFGGCWSPSNASSSKSMDQLNTLSVGIFISEDSGTYVGVPIAG